MSIVVSKAACIGGFVAVVALVVVVMLTAMIARSLEARRQTEKKSVPLPGPLASDLLGRSEPRPQTGVKGAAPVPLVVVLVVYTPESALATLVSACHARSRAAAGGPLVFYLADVSGHVQSANLTREARRQGAGTNWSLGAVLDVSEATSPAEARARVLDRAVSATPPVGLIFLGNDSSIFASGWDTSLTSTLAHAERALFPDDGTPPVLLTTPPPRFLRRQDAEYHAANKRLPSQFHVWSEWDETYVPTFSTSPLARPDACALGGVPAVLFSAGCAFARVATWRRVPYGTWPASVGLEEFAMTARLVTAGVALVAPAYTPVLQVDVPVGVAASDGTAQAVVRSDTDTATGLGGPQTSVPERFVPHWYDIMESARAAEVADKILYTLGLCPDAPEQGEVHTKAVDGLLGTAVPLEVFWKYVVGVEQPRRSRTPSARIPRGLVLPDDVAELEALVRVWPWATDDAAAHERRVKLGE